MVVFLIILSVMFLNTILVYLFWADFIGSNDSLKYAYLIIIFLSESILIVYFIGKFYDTPIKELKYFIQKLYTWQLKWEKIEISKSINKDLNTISNSIVDILKRLRNIKDEFIHGKAIKWEVELAKEIQWRTFDKKLTSVPSLNIIANSKPAWEIGWDSYDIIKSNENYYIYVADATGHWVWAWLIMMMVNSLIAWFAKVYIKWSQIMSSANEILKPRVKANLLMTVLLLRWNEEQKRLFMTWAWHEYLMIYKQKNKKCYKIKSWGLALGMVKNISKLLKEKEVAFVPWDIVVLYTDWITEAINRPKRDGSEKMFWEDNLMKTIEQSPNMKWKDYKTAQSIYNNITINLSKFMWYKPLQLDDVTLTVIQYKTKDYIAENDFPSKIWNDLITEWNWK
jgi:sigma-B regulation protein RsbU (phosphoserine phosphatase)